MQPYNTDHESMPCPSIRHLSSNNPKGGLERWLRHVLLGLEVPRMAARPFLLELSTLPQGCSAPLAVAVLLGYSAPHLQGKLLQIGRCRPSLTLRLLQMSSLVPWPPDRPARDIRVDRPPSARLHSRGDHIMKCLSPAQTPAPMLPQMLLISSCSSKQTKSCSGGATALRPAVVLRRSYLSIDVFSHNLPRERGFLSPRREPRPDPRG